MKRPIAALFHALAILGLLARFNRYAHGVEIPEGPNSIVCAAGFILGTTGLHLAGILIDLTAQRSLCGAQLIRIAGAVMAFFGLHILLS